MKNKPTIPGLMTIAELHAKVKSEHNQRMDEINQRGLVKIDPADGLLILNAGAFYGHRYEYEIDKPITRKNLADWLLHLRGKVWFGSQMQDDFLYIVERQLR